MAISTEKLDVILSKECNLRDFTALPASSQVPIFTKPSLLDSYTGILIVCISTQMRTMTLKANYLEITKY